MDIQKPLKNDVVAIYVHWSKENFLEETTMSYVKELCDACRYVLFVSNSPLNPKEINKLKNLGIMFHQRDNVGFDFWGWKEGISLIKEKVKRANNLILCNSSCYLAFNTLNSLLLKMDDEADLWGVSGFKERKLPFHLQSYFLVFKRKVLSNWDVFNNFWENLPEMKSWNDAVQLGELRLTAFFSEKGFKCRAVVDPKNLPSSDLNPSIYYPIYLFRKGSPFLKKKIFSVDYSRYLHNSYGNIPSVVLNYVKENGGAYNEILSSLIRKETPSKLIFTLHLNYIIGSEHKEEKEIPDVAVICYVYYEDMADYICEILNRFKKIANVIIVSSKKNLLEAYQALLYDSNLHVEYRLQENRGRNEAACFITCKDIWIKYEYVCMLHDKKSLHARPLLLGLEFMKHCELNLCPTHNSILEVLRTFQKNPLLGLLVPPAPFFGKFVSSVFNPLGRNLNSISLLNEKLFSGKLFFSKSEIDVFSAPFGGMFWARTAALSEIANANLTTEDFPKEPLKITDGTILNAFERCYPMVAKRSGFYTGRIINLALVPVLYDNQLYFNTRIGMFKKILFLITELVKEKICNHPYIYDVVKYIYNKSLNKRG